MSSWKSSARKQGIQLPHLLFSKDQKLRIGFSLLWLAIGLLQASVTDLLPDEAYYHLYSLHPAWGYFDHPPMIAMLIRAGSLLAAGEFGVRLLSSIISLAIILLLENWVKPQKPWLFFLSMSGIGLLHAASFLALPDVPLFLFALAYLISLKWYAQEGKWYGAVLLAVTAALMLYSKYHGILLIGLSLLAMPRLMFRWHFWLFPAISILLFLPHLWWQYQHGWPSLAYHLADRSPMPWELKFTLDYLWSQLLLPGPITGILLIILSFFGKLKSNYDRMERVLLVGIYCFFFLMSFKGPVEAHWTLLALLPAIYLGYPRLEEASLRLPRLVPVMLVLSLLIVMAGRVWLVLPDNGWKDNPFQGSAAWAGALQVKVGEKPVVFLNSYQKAAVYEFYTGREAFSLNNVHGRLNQYDLLDRETDLQGKAVMVVANWPAATFDSLETARGKEYFFADSSFASYNRIQITVRAIESGVAGGRGRATIMFSGHDSLAIAMIETSAPMLAVHFYRDGRLVHEESTGIWLSSGLLDDRHHRIEFPLPANSGEYYLRFSLARYLYPGGLQCRLSRIRVDEP